MIKDAQEVVREAERRKFDPSGYFLYAYAAVQVATELAARARVPDSRVMFSAATERPIPSAIGMISFDDLGELRNWRFGISSQVVYDQDACERKDCKNFDCPPDCPVK